MAQYADWIFVLARTNAQAKKQEGISFFLVDMKTPGITVKPIQTIDGGHEVNEVFFDNVRVPADALVGEENKGWDYAKFLLANERNGIARVGVSKARLDRVRQLASIPVYGSGPKIEDPFFRAKLAEVEVELKALEMTQMRVISNAPRRRQARTHVLGAEDQGLGDPADDHGTPDGGRRALRAAVSRTRRHEQRAAGRARTGRRRSRRFTSTIARSRSTADPTRSSAASSPRRYWGSEIHGLRAQPRTRTIARQCRAADEGPLRVRGPQDPPGEPPGLERSAMARLCRDGPARRALRRSGRRLRRRRGRDHDRDGGIRQGAGARALSSNRRPVRRLAEARRQATSSGRS